MNEAKIIELDGAGWKDNITFLTALRAVIGAPDWHGWGPDAFVDSMIWGGINTLDPPYTIVVKGLEHAPTEVARSVDLISSSLAEADEEHLASKGRRVDARVMRNPLQQASSLN